MIIPRGYRTLHSYRERGEVGPWSADLALDGRLLVSAHSDGVRLWDVFTGREIAFIDQRQPGQPLGYISSAIAHPDGKSFITCAPGDPKESRGVDLWPIESDPDVAAGRLRIGPPQRIVFPEGTKPERASLGADGRTLLVADRPRGQVIVLDLHDPSRKRLFPGHSSIAFVTISQNGQCIASATWQGNPHRVRVSDIGNPGATPRALLSESGRVSAAFSPDDKWLVTATTEKYQVWEVGSWNPVRELERDPLGSLAVPSVFSPDGTMLAIAYSLQTIKLFDVGGWNELATLEAPDPKMLSRLRFSRDSSQLAAVSGSYVIQLWDLPLIRQQVAEMKLDWDPPHSPSTSRNHTQSPLHAEIVLSK